MAIDDSPEAVGLRKIRRAFIHQAGGTVLQRAINNVAVSGDPANVGSTPISVFFVEIEHPFGRDVGTDGISASGVDDAFRLARCARGVKDVERMFGIERLRRAFIGGIGHQLVPPVVAAVLHVDWRARALIDNYVLDCWARFQSFFDRRKQFHFSAAPIRSILRHDQCGL